MIRTLSIALLIVATPSFANGEPCGTDLTEFRQAIVDRLPLGAKKNEDLDKVRACVTHLQQTKSRFAACLRRVEAFLDYEFNNPMGTTSPDGAQSHATNARFPDDLRNTDLFRALDEAALRAPASLDKVKIALDSINKKEDADWVMAWFAGHVDAVSNPLDSTGDLGYGRILMYSPKQRTWANFVIGMLSKGVGNASVNVSILKVDGSSTYFQDFTRRTDGESVSVTRAVPPGNALKCGQCHASGFLKAYPRLTVPFAEPPASYAIDPNLAKVNAKDKAPFAFHEVSVFGGTTVGDKAGNVCKNEDLQKARDCGSCHRDDGLRGPLYLGSQSWSVIERYVKATDGHGGEGKGYMPPSAWDWLAERRQRLYDCLKKDFETRFRQWLTDELPCK